MCSRDAKQQGLVVRKSLAGEIYLQPGLPCGAERWEKDRWNKVLPSYTGKYCFRGPLGGRGWGKDEILKFPSH
jgi:hypothetical protein